MNPECMNNLIKSLLTVIISSFACLANAQEISGTIVDESTGETLIGATVFEKGTSNGVNADFDGKFKLSVQNGFPTTLIVTFIGFDTLQKVVENPNEKLRLRLKQKQLTLQSVDIVETRLTERLRESAVTVESMDLIAIKETPSSSFYEGLGNLKGVDLTSASMGFKVINTRGFNSTRPVRSLQIIDGVDNQAPGLNFSVGNFAGVSELDIQKVELVVGANSALYGPNAFNGVISMTTKDPFVHQGLSVMGKVGERDLRETALRYARSHKIFGAEEDNIAYKINFSYMQANDWEADNLDPTEQSEVGADNPGGYDAVNVYGDEILVPGANNFTGTFGQLQRPGLGIFHRTGYQEKDLVDYDTENLKFSPSVQVKLTEDIRFKTTYNYGTGTTVYQGDNRYSLNGLEMQQIVGEISKPGKFYVRAYHTWEDAGDSYDAVFTALLLQRAAKSDADWSKNYESYWAQNYVDSVRNLPGYPNPTDPDIIEDWFNPDKRDSVYMVADMAIAENIDKIREWHDITRAYTDSVPQSARSVPFFEPGTARFDSAFQSITSKKTFLEGGSGFFDKSSLSHVQAEYKFEQNQLGIQDMHFVLGANVRQFNPNSRGTIFLDTGDITIVNREFGIYGSLEKRFFDRKLILIATGRLDKNENFDYLVSPAASIVYSINQNHTFRTSFSSAIRNPTLQDQYLYYNVGRAILIGNLNGFQNLVTVESYFDAYEGISFDGSKLSYFDVDPVRPEQVRTLEFGYKGTVFEKLFVDLNYYYNWYTDFLGYVVGAQVTVDTNLNLATLDQVYRVTANSPSQVTTTGASAGLNYYIDNSFMLSGNYSYNVLAKTDKDDPIIPAFNTPEHKYNIGLTGREFKGKLGPINLKYAGFNVTYKWIEGFLFEGSPQFTGTIPTYDMLDAQVNYRVPKIKTTFKLGASNILNKMNYQTYGGPQIGRMAYFSALVELDKL